jgi:hypothetical protein
VGQTPARVPGVVAESSRGWHGGHVTIVNCILGSQIDLWNPSPRGQGWEEIAYRHRAISFRG